MMIADPVYARSIESLNSSIQTYIETHPLQNKAHRPGSTLATYTIPVVVHVMHTGGAVGTIYNPSDAQILGAINYLNQVYAGTYSGMTAYSAGGAAGDMEIQFAMAQRTPTCGATNGIDRVDASFLPNYTSKGVNASNTDGCPEINVKDLARWNTSDYYNIWVVNKIDGKDGTSGQFIAGYAYFPTSSAAVDGTIMLATQMIAGQKTLPHEIGHALGLYHTFEGSDDDTQCPVNSNCTLNGDRVCDTDPVSNNYNTGTGLYNFLCRSGANTCTASNNYSINTESNFMAYTNCYTLFTNGQKARVQAAMSLPSRASLVSGSNMALVPCGSVINFSASSSDKQEGIVGGTDGCRTYKDYTYQLNIGSAPSATAIATLSYSGSAIQGSDFDITTNGDFNSPSNIITFPSGSIASHDFTIRIYDDGNVESVESLIVDFTVNAGGGDAVKGTTAPTFTFTVTDNDKAPVGASAATSAYTGPYVYDLDVHSPFRSSKSKHRVQYIIPADEVNSVGMLMTGNITALRFRISEKNSTKPYTGFTVAMGNTLATDLYTGFISPTLTTVYSANYSTIVGENVINFSAPFVWDGSSNILVNICFENATADIDDDLMEGNLPTGDFLTSYSDYLSGATAGCSLPAQFISVYRPRLSFDYNVAGTAIETVVSSSGSLFLNNASDDYFYSNNNKLLAKISNINSTLNCVSTTLDEAGTTWSGYNGGQRSQKVFAITPTSNGSTATYTVSLYYTNAELAGKNPATLKIAKTSAASVAASNGTNTILVTPTVTTLGSGVTVFTATFTGFSRFFLVDAAVTLPVTWLSFTGQVTPGNNHLLRWIVASENNNKQFDIEASSDGNVFLPLAYQLSAGNTNSQRQYEYVHINPSQGTTWYRIKQTDIDGRVSYSTIISLNNNKQSIASTIYPVPSQNRVTVNFGKLVSKVKMEIFTADMKSVSTEYIDRPVFTHDINIQHFTKGAYFIRISGNTSAEILRFIKN